MHCHCSVDDRSLKSTAQRIQQGAEQFWQLVHNYFRSSPSALSTQTKGESNTNHTVHLRQQLFHITQGLSILTHHIPGYYGLPVDDFFTLSPYEMLSLRGQDAQRVLLACPGLSIDDIRALVHIDCTLG